MQDVISGSSGLELSSRIKDLEMKLFQGKERCKLLTRVRNDIYKNTMIDPQTQANIVFNCIA